MVSNHDPVFTFFNLCIMFYSTDFGSIASGYKFSRLKSLKLMSWFVCCYGFVRQHVYRQNQAISNFYYFDRLLNWSCSRLALQFRVSIFSSFSFFVVFKNVFWVFHSSISAVQEKCSALRNAFQRSIVHIITLLAQDEPISHVTVKHHLKPYYLKEDSSIILHIVRLIYVSCISFHVSSSTFHGLLFLWIIGL